MKTKSTVLVQPITKLVMMEGDFDERGVSSLRGSVIVS